MIGWISLSCGTTLIFTWWMKRRELKELQADESTSVPEQLSRELAMRQPEADEEKAVQVTVQPALPPASTSEIR